MMLPFSAVFFFVFPSVGIGVAGCGSILPSGYLLPLFFPPQKILRNYWIGFLLLHVLARNIIPTYHLRKGGKIDSFLSRANFSKSYLAPEGIFASTLINSGIQAERGEDIAGKLGVCPLGRRGGGEGNQGTSRWILCGKS